MNVRWQMCHPLSGSVSEEGIGADSKSREQDLSKLLNERHTVDITSSCPARGALAVRKFRSGLPISPTAERTRLEFSKFDSPSHDIVVPRRTDRLPKLFSSCTTARKIIVDLSVHCHRRSIYLPFGSVRYRLILEARTRLVRVHNYLTIRSKLVDSFSFFFLFFSVDSTPLRRIRFSRGKKKKEILRV